MIIITVKVWCPMFPCCSYLLGAAFYRLAVSSPGSFQAVTFCQQPTFVLLVWLLFDLFCEQSHHFVNNRHCLYSSSFCLVTNATWPRGGCIIICIVIIIIISIIIDHHSRHHYHDHDADCSGVHEDDALWPGGGGRGGGEGASQGDQDHQ